MATFKCFLVWNVEASCWRQWWGFLVITQAEWQILFLPVFTRRGFVHDRKRKEWEHLALRLHNKTSVFKMAHYPEWPSIEFWSFTLQGRGLRWPGVSGVVETGGQLPLPAGRRAGVPPGSEGSGDPQQSLPLWLQPPGLHQVAPPHGRPPPDGASLSPPAQTSGSSLVCTALTRNLSALSSDLSAVLCCAVLGMMMCDVWYLDDRW